MGFFHQDPKIHIINRHQQKIEHPEQQKDESKVTEHHASYALLLTTRKARNSHIYVHSPNLYSKRKRKKPTNLLNKTLLKFYGGWSK